MLNEPDENGLIKAVVEPLDLGAAVIDFYMLPSGEKRLASENIGILLGYGDRWYYTRTKRQSKWLRALRSKGFTGEQIPLKIIKRNSNGEFINTGSVARSLSVRDFIKLVAYEAVVFKNLDAIILLAAFAEVGLERTLDDLFAGRSIEFLLEKIVHYSKWTYEDLEQALADCREDVRNLYSWSNPTEIELDDEDEDELPPSLEL